MTAVGSRAKIEIAEIRRRRGRRRGRRHGCALWRVRARRKPCSRSPLLLLLLLLLLLRWLLRLWLRLWLRRRWL